MMVGAASGDLLSPIQLFGQDEPDQLMGKHELGKRPDGIGACHQCLIDAIGATDNQHHAATADELLLQLGCQLR